ncbi:MAG: proteasome accessory factor PafA2 family protein [Actinomycetaceae bacterium]|nr:proteasome accessory factor PafA2 family protein [Actinomycetaceae bacterium]
MRRRIFGLETEFGVTCAGAAALDADAAVRRLFRGVQPGGVMNKFLPNGGRLYLDVGAHPEYATAECDDLVDLVANDEAGVAFYRDMLQVANAKLREEGSDCRIHLFKNNIDSVGNSYGCHENYLVRRRPGFIEKIENTLSFFVTRQIICGAGYIENTPEGARYCFSQRSDTMWEGISSGTTRSRPIINTRDEPLANSDLYRRLHVIAGDSNVAQVSTWLKVGTALLVLDALERGVSFDDLQLLRPLHAIRVINHDLSVQTKVELANGRFLTALEIQKEFLDRIDPNYLGEVATTWAKVLEAIACGDLDKIAAEVDWAAKYRILRRARQKHGWELGSAQIRRLDLAYHDICDLGPKMHERGLLRPIVNAAATQKAKEKAPSTTRANVRGAAIASAQANRLDLMADWSHLRLQTQETIVIDDPFANTDPRVSELIEKMETK